MPLNCLNLETLLMNCEINLILGWAESCIIFERNTVTNFTITDTKLYVPVATLLMVMQIHYSNIANWNDFTGNVDRDENATMFFRY